MKCSKEVVRRLSGFPAKGRPSRFERLIRKYFADEGTEAS